MTLGNGARRTTAGLAFAPALAAPTFSVAQVYTGPDPALAPGEDRCGASATTP